MINSGIPLGCIFLTWLIVIFKILEQWFSTCEFQTTVDTLSDYRVWEFLWVNFCVAWIHDRSYTLIHIHRNTLFIKCMCCFWLIQWTFIYSLLVSSLSFFRIFLVRWDEACNHQRWGQVGKHCPEVTELLFPWWSSSQCHSEQRDAWSCPGVAW